MEQSSLIESLKSGQGGYPHSQKFYNDEKYIKLIEDFLLYTEHVVSISDNANKYAKENIEDRIKREKDQKLITILDKNRENMWKQIENYNNPSIT